MSDNGKRWQRIGVTAAVALTAVALVWALWTPKEDHMTDPLARFQHLWHYFWFTDDLSREESAVIEEELLVLLADHPELDSFFLDRYVTRHADEGELGSALGFLAYLGKRRPHDHVPLLALLRRDDIDIHEKRRALFCITQLADHLDERVLLDLLDTLGDDLNRSAVCKTIDALASVRDRSKAARLLRRCLKPTDTTDPESMVFLLSNLVEVIEGNEDIFEAVLLETQVPHEIVLLVVSLMKKTLPVFSPHRRLADEAAARSQLADDYYNLYVGTYVAKAK